MIAREPQTTARVALRPLCQTDLPNVHRWLTDPIAARFCGWDNPEIATPGRIEGKYLPAIMDPEGADAWHFIMESGGAPIGLVSCDLMEPHSRSCRIFLLIGDISMRGRGLGMGALKRLLSLLFESAEMHRVWVAVHARNTDALRFFRQAGFREESVQREAVRFEDGWEDLVIMSMLESEWARCKDPVEWTVTPLCPGEEDWFTQRAQEAQCDPDEIAYAREHDEISVWRAGGCPAAVAALNWRTHEVEIHILGVDPAFRRQGLATRMLHAIRAQAEARGLHRICLLTSNDNCPAMTLYQKAGFHMKAIYPGRLEARRGYVRYGVNGIPVRDDIELMWDI